MAGRICVGVIAGAFGVRGEVRLKSFCAVPQAIADYGPLWAEGGSQCFEVTLGRPVGSGFSARLSGVRDRAAAQALKGIRLYADRAVLPMLPDDEFYHADLIGLQVADTDGAILGRIDAVMDHGAGDLLEVCNLGGDSVLLPFTRQAVPVVDLAAGRIVADPPEGLFPAPPDRE